MEAPPIRLSGAFLEAGSGVVRQHGKPQARFEGRDHAWGLRRDNADVERETLSRRLDSTHRSPAPHRVGINVMGAGMPVVRLAFQEERTPVVWITGAQFLGQFVQKVSQS